MILYAQGDITLHKFDNKLTIIPHIVNNKCINGSGVTVALNKRWNFIPDLKKFYRQITWDHVWSTSYNKDGSDDIIYTAEWQLGHAHFHRCENVVIASMIAQSTPSGETIDDVYLRPIRLECLEECMLRVSEFAKIIGCTNIVAPKFGGLRAGANFDKEIKPLIEKRWSHLEIIIYEYKE